MHRSLLIVIPVYKESLNLLEQFSLDYLLTKANDRAVTFIGPKGLDTRYYRERFPNNGYEMFDAAYFESIAGYNELLLNPDFYARFAQYDYILIHQTDALLFKDNLDDWMDAGYHYLGAPWPLGMTLNFGPDDAEFFGGGTFNAFVGNGGFSLRHVEKSRAILDEAGRLLAFWHRHKLNEDCFFAFAALLYPFFKVPAPSVASRFSLELEPEKYVATNQGEIPTGCHAWWKHDLPFWQKVIAVVK
jgi:Protein of unknown function (DUF5672)